jgi:hypothetical protein
MRILIKIVAFIILLFSSFLLYDRFDMRAPIAFDALYQIDPLPHTKALIAEEKLLDAQEYLSFFMQFNYMKEVKEANQLLKEIQEKRDSLGYKTQKILTGIALGRSDEIEGQISAGISDFFLLGDLRDLTIEGYHHLNHQEVDKTLVALSSIGLIASASTMMSAGATSPFKGSISFLKIAKKSGNLPTWLNKSIIKEATIIKKSKNLKKLKTLFHNLYQLMTYAGIRGGLKLLKHTKNSTTLKEAINFAKVYGKNSALLSNIAGKNLIKYSKNVDKKAFLYASTYGESGLKRVRKLGEKGFLKSLVKPIKKSRLIKIVDKNILHILNQIPNRVLITLWVIAIMILL